VHGLGEVGIVQLPQRKLDHGDFTIRTVGKDSWGGRWG